MECTVSVYQQGLVSLRSAARFMDYEEIDTDRGRYLKQDTRCKLLVLFIGTHNTITRSSSQSLNLVTTNLCYCVILSPSDLFSRRHNVNKLQHLLWNSASQIKIHALSKPCLTIQTSLLLQFPSLFCKTLLGKIFKPVSVIGSVFFYPDLLRPLLWDVNPSCEQVTISLFVRVTFA